MTEAHIGSVLPIKNRVLAAGEDTVFLAHYDLNEQDVLQGVKALGERNVADFKGAGMVETPSQDPAGTTTFSIECWINWAGVNTSENIVYCQENTYEASVDDGTFWVAWNPYWAWVGNVPVVANEWTHFATTYDGAMLRIYKNGVLSYSRSQSGGIERDDDTAPFRIGARGEANTAPRNPFIGQVHSVRVWNKTLSENSIRELMLRDPTGDEQKLVGWWPLTEGSGIVAHDQSGQGSDGLFVGDAGWTSGDSIFTLQEKEGKFGGAIAVEEGTVNIAAGTISSVMDLDYSYIGEENGYTKYGISGTWNSGTYPYSFAISGPNYPMGESYSTSCRLYTNVPEKFTSRFGEMVVVNDSALTGARFKKREGHYSAIMDYIHSEDMTNATYLYSCPIIDGTVFDPATDFLYIKDIQIENNPFATSFVQQNRPKGMLKYDLTGMGIDPLGDWTISGWFKRHPNPTGWASLFGIGNYYAVGESEFTVWTNHSEEMKAHTHDNRIGGGAFFLTPGANELEEWFYVAVTHKKETHEFNAYVWTKNQYVKKTWTDELLSPMEPTLYVGRSSSSSHIFNGLIDELRIDKVVRTGEEIAAWYHCNSPFWPRGIYRKDQ